MSHTLRTIQEDGDAVVILDQTRLPHETAFVILRGLEDAAHAIRVMQVRGAPLIGATAAYGVALALQEGCGLDEALTTLGATRPTAVNLHWALARMRRILEKSAPAARRETAWNEARAIAGEDEVANAAIGQYGLPLLAEIATRKGGVNVMTHCNAGWLATVANGTALAPIYAAQAAGLDIHVWVSETRPRNQGHLTAWELGQAGIPHTLIADNAAGLLMMQGKVDCVIVGADRIAANGDTANKIGTYLKALAAREHGVPFYVAAPVSTIDFACPSGAHIPIEERAGAELGAAVAKLDTAVANPAFDVTPAGLISGVITEYGVHAPTSLASLTCAA
ncbi:MAG: S-methyl-5-thioribose-1-phosphate isomerase [Gammaproteobacteria bacterium]|nr:S-methyl-5-thioribose-1-phosphate isomerase [Gammaproteobacteria bacterium]MBU1645972.1 S-methyl-5-thioribose-1-phosphate isomerase [Gammaproteobacteria bacterium]MBU1972034.1 S-methyl-5-thioribose-1-phosphate isomerase [Gammaproteobacteria bacterium]